MLHTFDTLASLAAVEDNSGPDGARRYKEQLRGLHQRGLIKAVPEVAARGARQFDIEESCLARLLLVLLSVGVEGDRLAKASTFIRFSKRSVHPDGTHYEFSIKAALEGVRNTKDWVLVARGGVDMLEGGRPALVIQLCPKWAVAEFFDPTDPMPDYFTPGVRWDWILKTAVNPLLLPLIAKP